MRRPAPSAILATIDWAALRSWAANSAWPLGKFEMTSSATDAGHHYFMARGSAMECAAHLDVMTAMAVVDADRYRRGIELLERVVAMLTKMCDL